MNSRYEHAARVFARTLRNGNTVGLGSSPHMSFIVKAIRQRMIEEDLYLEVVPSTMDVAHLLAEYKIPMGKMRGKDLDVSLEFADRADKYLNYVKTGTNSLLRDKTLVLDSRKNVVILTHPPLREKLNGLTPFEVNRFAVANTIRALSSFGSTYIRVNAHKQNITTEDSNYLVNVDISEEFDMEDVDEVARKIPGVLETGIFMHLADEVILLEKDLEVISARA